MTSRPTRQRVPPKRLDNGGDETALQQALNASRLNTGRVEVDIPEAPVFRPSTEEFQDPLKYIQSIRAQAQPYGICKIIPPPGSRPVCRPERISAEVSFSTKKQALRDLEQGKEFDQGREYNLMKYKEQADAFCMQWMRRIAAAAGGGGGDGRESTQEESAQLQSGPSQHPQQHGIENVSDADIERAYWRIVENVYEEDVHVEYANDLNSKRYGTLMGNIGENQDQPHPWDLNHLTHQPLSVLRELDRPIEGVTFPWLYFGMLFATFCWHTEDHFLYSINYLHFGASKTWYGVPGRDRRRFESLLRRSIPARFSQAPDLLYLLTTMFPPTRCRTQAQPLDVHHLIQRPGEFVVTFPEAYHCGFSHGFNCAEAVNFGLADWIPVGTSAVDDYRQGRGKRATIFSHDRLLLSLAVASTANTHPGKPKDCEMKKEESESTFMPSSPDTLPTMSMMTTEEVAREDKPLLSPVFVSVESHANTRIDGVKTDMTKAESAEVCVSNFPELKVDTDINISKTKPSSSEGNSTDLVVLQQLQTIWNVEKAFRKILADQGMNIKILDDSHNPIFPSPTMREGGACVGGSDFMCAARVSHSGLCEAVSFLSCVTCMCTPGRVLCPSHALEPCQAPHQSARAPAPKSCTPNMRTLWIQVSSQQMEETIARLRTKISPTSLEDLHVVQNVIWNDPMTDSTHESFSKGGTEAPISARPKKRILEELEGTQQNNGVLQVTTSSVHKAVPSSPHATSVKKVKIPQIQPKHRKMSSKRKACAVCSGHGKALKSCTSCDRFYHARCMDGKSLDGMDIWVCFLCEKVQKAGSSR